MAHPPALASTRGPGVGRAAGGVGSDPRALDQHALAEGGKPLATLVAQRHKVAPLQAALINGTAAHSIAW